MTKMKWQVGVLAALAIVAQTSAGLLDITGGYNVLTFGNFTSENDQIAGEAAVSGNVTIGTSYSVGYALSSTSLYSLVAGGDVAINNGSVKNGGILAGGTVTLNNVDVQGTIVENANVASEIDFSATKAELVTLSNTLAATTATGTAENKWGGLFLTGTSEGVNYFTIDASQFSGISYIEYSLPTNSTAIITVTGSTANLTPTWGGNFGVNGLTKSDGSRILYNFVDATSLTIGSSIGTILAPNATVTLVGGEIWGDLISGTVSGTSEFHLAHYTGETPTEEVPEAPTTAMMVAGILFLAVVSRKKLATSKN
jgi:choice-of-anchor A domain-containing protein